MSKAQTQDVLIAIPTIGRAEPETLLVCSNLKAGAMRLYRVGSAPVQINRNAAVREFLDKPEFARFQYLLFIDDDTVPMVSANGEAHNPLELLLDVDADIVTGFTPSVALTEDFTFLNVAPLDGKNHWYRRYPDEVVEVSACGMSCCMIHRRVLEAVVFPWFSWLETREGKVVGEDLLFCHKARKLGFKIFAHPQVRCNHFKVMPLAVLVPSDGPLLMNMTKELADRNVETSYYHVV